MRRSTTFSAGSHVPAATLNAMQDEQQGLVAATRNPAGALALAGADGRYLTTPDAGVADGHVITLDDSVDWRARALWGSCARLESAAQRIHGASAWQRNDVTHPVALRSFSGDTGTGGRGAASATVVNGTPPVVAAGSFAIVVDELDSAAHRVWIYADPDDGALCLYNASGLILHAELFVWASGAAPTPGDPPPDVIPTLTDVLWVTPGVAAARPADPGGPAIYRSTDTGAVELWDGAAWRSIGGGAGGVYLPRDGSQAMAGNLDMGDNKISDLSPPELDSDAARLDTVTDAIAALRTSRRWPATAATRLLWECDGASGAIVCTGSVGSAGNLAAGSSLGRNALSPYSTIGRGVRCDGTSTGVASGAAGVAPAGTATALTAWVVAALPDNPSGGDQQLLARDYHTPSSWAAPWVSVMLTLNGSQIKAHATIGGTYVSVTGPYPIHARQILAGLTYDGATLRLWVDGVEAASFAIAGTIDWGPHTDALWYLGADGGGERYPSVILRAGVEAEVWDAATWASRYETLVGAST